MIQEGKKAPAFSTVDQNGRSVKLANFKGKWVVLYFYPKDMTSGCTVEANDFQARLKEFEKAGAAVLGVSRDSQKKHCQFREKEGLAFDLLSDEEGSVTEAYGVWVEKSMYGRKYMGIERTTVLITPDAKIAKIWPKVKVNGHAQEVLETLRSLSV